MSRLLREDDSDAASAVGGRGWIVEGQWFENTAAKFWSGLVDEAVLDYPGCDSVSLAALGNGRLTQDLLHPVCLLQRELDHPSNLSLEEAIRQAAEDKELFGPEAAVSIALLAGPRKLCERALPTDAVNAPVFAYLLAWLLAWCGVPANRWNEELLSGVFSAVEPHRRVRYGLSAAVRNRHLSEDLFQRKVAVLIERSYLGEG
jgi:hypothetical protein